MLPESCVAAEVTRQTSLFVVVVLIIIPRPLPIVRPPFAAKFQPVAAVVPPASAATFEAQFVPEPEISATLFAAAVTRFIEQIYVRPAVPLIAMICVVVAVTMFTTDDWSQVMIPVRFPDPFPPM